MKKGAKIAIGIIIGLAVLGTVAYFVYMRRIGGLQKQPQFEPDLPTPPPSPTPAPSTTPPSGTGNFFTDQISLNTPAEILAFQRWVINVKGDKTILGTSGPSGYGDDGIYGSKTADAWAKYGQEYQKALQQGTAAPIDQEKKTYTDSQYETMAQAVYAALSIVGTNESLVKAVFDKLRSNADYYALKKKFGEKTDPLDLTSRDMKEYIKSEMSQFDINKYINKPMKANGLTVWVS